MTCKEKILSEEYTELLIDYTVPPELWEERYDPCIIPLEGEFSVVYIKERLPLEGEMLRFSYYTIPKCYGLMQDGAGYGGAFDPLPLLSSGISQVQNPPLSLTGRNVIIGIIDTGIRYTQDVFRDGNGNSRITSIWDQTIQTGTAPEGYFYGSEYTKEQINEALQAENPREVVPSWDQDGHGTALASVAAGSVLENGLRFQGAAPDVDIVVVKLRPARRALKEYYYINEEAQAYSEADIMLAIKYVNSFATTFVKPVVVCLGIGTNSGSHAGNSPLDRYADSVARMISRAVVICGGNEGEAAHHYQGELGEGVRQVEIRVGEGERGFQLEFWGEVSNLYRISVRSPAGERIIGISGRAGSTQTYRFIFAPTVLTVNYLRLEQSGGRSLILFRFRNPDPGVWSFEIEAIGTSYGGVFHMWLPITEFLSSETYFLTPSPYVTLTAPAYVPSAIAVTAYDDRNNSFYASSGRGFASDGRIKPDLAVPGVEISTSLGKQSGTSIASAMAAGAAAQFLQWAAVDKNYPLASGREVKNFFILGASRDGQTEYPNREWGYGRLNLRGIFERLSEIG